MEGKQRKNDLQIEVSEATYVVTVDYDKSLEEMLLPGNYDLVQAGEEFQIQGIGQRTEELFLVRFIRRPESTDEAVAQFRDHGFEPAGIEFLLALGAAFPQLGRGMAIWSLVFGDDNYLGDCSWPCLSGDANGRIIGCHGWIDSDYFPGSDEDFYLAMRKK